MGVFNDTYTRSIDDPTGFWGDAATAIHWEKAPSQVLDDTSPPFYRWFPDGRLNTCFNALDRWVDGGDGADETRGEQLALVYDSPVTDTVCRYTYRELRDEVAVFAGALVRLGVAKGDRVVAYMPMVPEAVITMLACARIGAVHSVVFGGFAPAELALRIDDATPKVIVSASCGIEGTRVLEYKPLLDEALQIATHKPDACVILQRPMVAATLHAERDLDWATAIKDAHPAPCVEVGSSDPLYILYTSGTTGKPKGVVRDNGGHAVALRWSMENVYGVSPGDVYWAASDVGWVVGHSYIVYGPLLAGCTSILYEGKPVGTPDAGAFWRVIADHAVEVLFTAPTALRAVKKEDAAGVLCQQYDLSSLRALFLAGERTDPDTYHWACELLAVPVIDHWWQTETGWAIAGNCLGIEKLPIKPGSSAHAVPGYQLGILDEAGQEVPGGEDGAVVVRLPLPPGAFLTIWQDDERFVQSYFSRYPGWYLTGDGGRVDEDNYLSVMGRIDDVINVAGHRLSTGAMEEVLAAHPGVAECAVIGIADALRGQVPLGLVVLKMGVVESPASIEAELIQLMRDKIGPVASFKRAIVVQRLPKTRSGKILRATMRAIADGHAYQPPSTIDDPAILDEISAALQT